MKNRLVKYVVAMLAFFSVAQMQADTLTSETSANTKMNSVFWVILIIFGGITVTLLVLERRLNKIEKRQKEN